MEYVLPGPSVGGVDGAEGADVRQLQRGSQVVHQELPGGGEEIPGPRTRRERGRGVGAQRDGPGDAHHHRRAQTRVVDRRGPPGPDTRYGLFRRRRGAHPGNFAHRTQLGRFDAPHSGADEGCPRAVVDARAGRLGPRGSRVERERFAVTRGVEDRRDVRSAGRRRHRGRERRRVLRRVFGSRRG